MRLHRFIGDFDLSQSTLEIQKKDFLNQIKNVLRLKIGDELMLGNGQKQDALTRIVELGKTSVRLDVEGISPNENEPENYVTLYCSILRKDNFELATQKAVEAGVSEIQPIITRRTVKTALNLSRLEKIVKEAAEQSGRGIVPAIQPPIDFESSLKKAQQNNMNIFFRPSGAALSQVKIYPPKVGVFIGPEGGWDEAETAAAEGSKMTMVTLGKLILKAETAAAVGVYLATHNFLQKG